MLAALGAALALSACGAEETAVGEGGSVTIAQTSQPDALDPALSYTANGWEPMWLVYTPLLTYRRAEGTGGAELIPGLAEDLPAVSEDGRTYTLRLREGLRYADGTPVRASDFEHTIARVLNLGSGGSSFYEFIAGAKDYQKQDDPEADISGIEADDEAGEITIELTEPVASFSNILAMNFAGLVPGDTPFRNLTEDPPPGVGPYEITESVPNREFTMERVQGFADLDIPDVPTGHIDTIVTEIVKNQTQQAQDVLDNKLDYMQDSPPADIKPAVRAEAADRYEEHASASTYYFFLNVTTPPFDDPRVREAVNYGMDKPGLARLYAGELAPGCSFLPPGFPGYDEELDTTGCPWGNPSEPPDVERARELISGAGAEGAEVTVWGNSDDPTDKVTEAYADMLNEIGLDAEPKILGGGVYFQTIGSERTNPQTGFTNWFQDFPHPLNFYFQLDGDSIQPANNPNFGYVDDERINEEIDELQLEPDVQAVADEWADLDRYVAESAYIAPYGHLRLSTFLSDRLDFDAALFHPVYSNDYSSWRLKEE